MNDAALCPCHLEIPALGACSRCGSFFCALCFADAELETPTDATHCPRCPPPRPEPKRLGGFLIVPAFHVALFGPAMALGDLGRFGLSLPALPGLRGLLLLPFIAANVAYAAVSLHAAWLFFQRKQRAIAAMKRFYLVGLLLRVVERGSVWFGNVLSDRPAPEETIAELLGAAFLTLLWIVYFDMSKRVKATFVV